jgi:hypothetical protein
MMLILSTKMLVRLSLEYLKIHQNNNRFKEVDLLKSHRIMINTRMCRIQVLKDKVVKTRMEVIGHHSIGIYSIK